MQLKRTTLRLSIPSVYPTSDECDNYCNRLLIKCANQFTLKEHSTFFLNPHMTKTIKAPSW